MAISGPDILTLGSLFPSNIFISQAF